MVVAGSPGTLPVPISRSGRLLFDPSFERRNQIAFGISGEAIAIVAETVRTNSTFAMSHPWNHEEPVKVGNGAATAPIAQPAGPLAPGGVVPSVRPGGGISSRHRAGPTAVAGLHVLTVPSG